MSGENATDDTARYEALNTRVAASEARITASAARMAAIEASLAALHERVDGPPVHASTEGGRHGDRNRISALEGRMATSMQRADTSDLHAAADRDRIWALEGRANVDAVLIAELQTEGVVAAEQTANLETALRTSRTIGAALGILMTRHSIGEADAFALLRKASMDSNRKLRELAEDVVFTGAIPRQNQ